MKRRPPLLRTCLIALALGVVCLLGWTPLATLAAVILVLWLPGATVLRALPRLDDLPGRGAMSVATSMAFVVIPLSWFWRFSNDPVHVIGFVMGLNLLLSVFVDGIFAKPIVQTCRPPYIRSPWLLTSICGWTGVCVFGSFWIPTALDRTATNPAHDYVKHHAIVYSLGEHPLPLHNGFIALEPKTPYYYYEYHYLLSAAIRAMTGMGISVACAFGLVSAILAVVIVRIVFWISHRLFKSIPAALLSAACVSVVGGWDIVPILVQTLRGGSIPVILDSWCPVAWRIHNLATQYGWCPQHMGAVCTVLLTAYWLTHAPTGRFWLVIGPLLGASVFGASVYVAIPVFASTAIYCLHRLWRGSEGRGRLFASIVSIAVVGAVLMISQALGYQEMASRFDGGLTFQWERFPLAALGKMFPPGLLANFADAWWLVLIDFGLPAVALVLIDKTVWRRAWESSGMRLLLICGAVGYLAMFSMRSSINPIDYGFRVAIMLSMIVAAILTGALLCPDMVRPVFARVRKPMLAVGIMLSLPVGFFELPLSAARTLIQKTPDHDDAGAYRYLREETPREAVVQAAPTTERVTLLQIISRQIGASDPDNWHVRVFWPPDASLPHKAATLAESAFKASDSQAAYDALRRLGVTHLLVGSVEKGGYDRLDQFADKAYFEVAYTDEHATVYRLQSINSDADVK